MFDEIVGTLRQHGARFAYVFGSRAEGRASAHSDTDIAAHFGGAEVDELDIRADLPADVDLLVLDDAPLDIAGRVALTGRMILDDDPAERVEWEATTRKIYDDERPRMERARADFKRALLARGRR